MTPSLVSGLTSRSRKAATYLRIYPRAPSGFIFHDTDAAIDIADIRHALHRLANLHEVGEEDAPAKANQALALRVDANTLVASFSMSALPTPTLVATHGGRLHTGQNTREWLGTQSLTGWFVESVQDPSVAATPFVPNAFYDECTRLERLTGHCPCALLTTKECQATWVAPRIPEPFRAVGLLSRDFPVDYTMLRKVAYVTLPGEWKRTSPKTTATYDFTESIRPWDYQTFVNIEARQELISARAKTRHARVRHVATKCNSCELATRYRGAMAASDCGLLRDCTAPSTPEMVQRVLDDWLDTSSYLSMPGFTDAQRDYLIRLGGTTVLAKTFSPSRRVKNLHAGFMRTGYYTAGSWVYQLVSAGNNLSRYLQYNSYKELQEVLPELPDSPEVGPVDRRVLYVLAAFGNKPTLRRSGSPTYHLRSIQATFRGDGSAHVHVDGANSRYVACKDSCDSGGFLKDHVRINSDLTAPKIAQIYSRLPIPALAAADTKVRLPVILS